MLPAGPGNAAAGARSFHDMIKQHIASSAVLLYQGKPSYPTRPRPPTLKVNSPLQKAQSLEFQQQNYSASYDAYQQLAQLEDNIAIQAQARMGMARSLNKMGKPQKARQTLMALSQDPLLSQVSNQQGRNIQANVLYQLLTTYGEAMDPELHSQLTQQLVQRLQAYQAPSMLSQQRLHLMYQLNLKYAIQFPSYGAELLANQYLREHRELSATGVLQRSNLAGVYHFAANSETILLFDNQFIEHYLSTFQQSLTLPEGLALRLRAPGQTLQHREAVLAPLRGPWENWQLALVFGENIHYREIAEKQVAAYWWAALLIVVAIALLGLVTANIVLHQIRQAKLKSDLIATVSHELKTPLTAVRVLVDTLLASSNKYDATTQDYLTLIAKENTRLSQLIDNFLTFSRMEKNRQVFDFAPCLPQQMVDDVVAAAATHLREKGFSFEVQVEPQLPKIRADKNMLTTALLNLLENAQKYSKECRQITLKVSQHQGAIHFAVQDQGIGIEKKHLKKIFERFYRVDNQLSRSTEGCGIGLNIVEFIAKAHGGGVRVSSTLHQGSTFTLVIPAC